MEADRDPEAERDQSREEDQDVLPDQQPAPRLLNRDGYQRQRHDRHGEVGESIHGAAGGRHARCVVLGIRHWGSFPVLFGDLGPETVGGRSPVGAPDPTADD
jgi:hypothetical protein